MFFKTAALLSLIPFALASPQYGPFIPPTTTSSTSAAASPSAATLAQSNQIIVQVSPNGQFVFSPSDIQAPTGTLVTFAFPGSIEHSVTQSTFADPCTPASGGFDSGLVGGAGVTYSVNITDASQPIYFFCKFPAHCGLGMVGTINAPSGSANGSFSTFQAAAQAIGASEPDVTDNGAMTGGIDGAIATALTTQGTPSVSGGAASTGAPAPSNSGSSNGAAQLTLNAGTGLFALLAGAILAL